MDIALCKITYNTTVESNLYSQTQQNKNLILNFSGANRPLFIKYQSSDIMDEVKGSKKAIGGLSFGLVRSFENHAISIDNGDTIYISSDGIVDQFGGPDNKKLTSKKFRQMLLSIQALSMKQQLNHISNFMKTWQGEFEQVDDMLLIGIRF